MGKLSFEYCECGCKGYSAELKGLGYWIFWDLKQTWQAFLGHGFSGVALGKFPSMIDAEAACQTHYDSV